MTRRSTRPPPSSRDPLGQAIAGGLAWLLRERLELGGGGSVQDLLPRMTEVVLAPQPAHG